MFDATKKLAESSFMHTGASIAGARKQGTRKAILSSKYKV